MARVRWAGWLCIEMTMAEPRKITLGEREIPVPPIPLGRVRRLPVVCTRVFKAFALNVMDDAVADDILLVLHLGTGIPLEELDAIPAQYDQLADAIDTIADVAGLKPKGAAGAAQPGEALTPATTQSAGGTTSTLT